MRVLVSGASGLIGSALVAVLEASQHEVVRLVRSAPRSAHEILLDQVHDAPAGPDAVVHLAGENIASGRWTPARKALIRDSRVQGTRLLSEALASRTRPPRVLVCASAVGYYGNRGDEVLTEDSPVGRGFLSEVCRAWEDAAEPARQKGIRVVYLRFGMVLSRRGGALAKMLPIFKLGLGGVVGGGRQYVSWVALDDAVRAIQFALADETLRGPVNVTAPYAVTNREFTKTLGRVLHRPTLLPVPALALGCALGEMADELLLASQRVEPAKLREAGLRFEHADLESAVRGILRGVSSPVDALP